MQLPAQECTSDLETECPNEATAAAGSSTPTENSSSPAPKRSSKPNATRAAKPTRASSPKPAPRTSAIETTPDAAEQSEAPSPRASDHAYREGRFRRDRWETEFLDHFRQNGYLRAAAEAAGVDVKTVRRHLKDDPAFAALVDEAREEFREYLEHQFVRMARGEIRSGGFMALMARIKAELPAKYNDKLQIDGVFKNLNANVFATPDEARDLLRVMLADATDITKAALQGRVIDVPALPAERQPE